jgi:hypothetical protein
MFFRLHLRDAARGRTSYAELGWHLGRYHLDTFEVDESQALNISNWDFEHPTRALRRLFASEQHPEAGIVDCIPPRRRAAFLRGLVCGAAGYDPADAVEFRWDKEEDEGQPT